MGGTVANVLQNPKFLEILRAVAQMAQGGGQRQGAQPPIPAQPGRAPQTTPPPTMGTPAAGPNAPVTGQFPLHTATPQREGYQVPSESGQMMSKLAPNAAGVYAGVQGVSKLLQDWNSRQDQKQHVEAENIAKNLMQAMEATNSPDEKTKANAIATVHEILNDKHSTKVLNKVYKGWLQKSKEAQKPGEPPDPAVAGFEKGLQDYIQGKSKQAPQMPATMSGYRLPQAGPAQQTATTQAQTGAITAQQDLVRAKAGQPTAAQLAEQEKYAAEQEKYKAEVQTAALNVQRAQAEAQKAQLDLQVKQSEAQMAKQRGEAAKALDDARYQKSLVDLDIVKTRLALAKLGPKTGGKGQQPPPGLLKPINAAKQAEAYVESVLNSRGDDGFTKEDVTALGGMLQQAGASNLAKALPGWIGRHAPSWIGGTGKDDVQSMLNSVRQYKAGLETTVNERYPDWRGASGLKAESDEGEEDDSDIVVSPEDVK